MHFHNCFTHKVYCLSFLGDKFSVVHVSELVYR